MSNLPPPDPCSAARAAHQFPSEQTAPDASALAFEQISTERRISEKLLAVHIASANQFSEQHAYDPYVMRQALQCTDLTSLKTTDSTESILHMAGKAAALAEADSELGVAALCVYPRFAADLVQTLQDTDIRTAAVGISFPHGQADLQDKLVGIHHLVSQGVNEVDELFPVGKFLAGKEQEVFQELQAMSQACGDNVRLKVILETGSFPEGIEGLQQIARATNLVLHAGANPKSSTGKEGFDGAAPETVATMLLVAADFEEATGQSVLVKPSGGIKTPEDAAFYIGLVRSIRGEEAVSPDRLRFGASSLVGNLLQELVRSETALPERMVAEVESGTYFNSPAPY